MIKHQIDVNLPGRQYPIYIGSGLYADRQLLTQHIKSQQVLFVSNNTLAKLYLGQLKQALSGLQCDEVILPDGEKAKTLASWEQILNQLASQHHHRDSTLITLGGGVVGDVGGFAAACYQRGIPFLQIPTTLLAQVDASIGGKTAVNHPVGKNLIGAFYQPQAVVIDLDVLQTLPQRELKAGLAEIVKAALIQDADFFAWLEQHQQQILALDPNALGTAIKRACEIKRDIVVQDEKEANLRALLNLGHTFAHAIEHLLGYGQWLHGEAVAVGLVLAAKLSQQKNRLDEQSAQRVEQLLKKIGLPTALPRKISQQQLVNAMKMDKKVQAQKLRLVLMNDLGAACLCDDVNEQELLDLA